jgi:hypothetical protein
VGNVYLRIYNNNPTFLLEDPKRFAVDLLEFIEAKREDLVSQSLFPSDDTKHGQMALESLGNIGSPSSRHERVGKCRRNCFKH